jgi:hypothetical protein
MNFLQSVSNVYLACISIFKLKCFFFKFYFAAIVKYFYEMLSPRVMLFILISVAGLSLAILFIGYYWFFLRYIINFKICRVIRCKKTKIVLHTK